MNELEIGAVGTDFSRRTSWWARENLGRSRKWKSMINMHSEMYTDAKSYPKMDQTHIFLDETECILNEKMMPNVTITVPELEIVKKHIGHQYFHEETFGPYTHKPSNSLLFSKKLSGASPYMEMS
jgi:hypothetical protein